ncbi:MAG: amino-acid N-acetyltransferase [Gammaproteobacteria bacterium]|nr:MAG: amino-acid N-acetyltransferase [Gammaproteobacteria bacterium]
MAKRNNTSIQDNKAFVEWFRQSTPYLRAHRNRTFVISIPGEAIEESDFASLIHDIALLNNLGIRIVLIHGIRPQIETCLHQRGHKSRYHNGLRITDDIAMECAKQAGGTVRVEIEALLSTGLANTPIPCSRIQVASGNYVIARPIGVLEGVDFMHTGAVRRIDVEAINQRLNDGAVVLISPVGYSPTSEIFNLSSDDVAEAAAIALSADKLIILSDEAGIRDSKRRLIGQLTTHEARELLQGRRKLNTRQQALLHMAIGATDIGVKRVHILNRKIDGALLQELFSRDGIGTLVSSEPYDTIRQAHIEDIPGILMLIEPLEQSGTLVRRSRDILEMEIHNFLVAERDGAVIGCAALYPYEKEGLAELACLTVEEKYRNSGSGAQLLKAIESRAHSLGIHGIFVLTTQTAHWFRERGFNTADIADLPLLKRKLYNYQRRSKVFIKSL